MKINFVKKLNAKTNYNDVIIYVVSSQSLNMLDSIFFEIVKKFNFCGKYKEILDLKYFNNTKRTILLGMGDLQSDNESLILKLGGFLYDYIYSEEEISINILNDNETQNKAIIKDLVQGLRIKSIDFTKYITEKSIKEEAKLDVINIIGYDSINLDFQNAEYEGILLAKNLVNEPANILYPESFIKYISDLETLGIKITILSTLDLQKLNMEAFLSVAKGSDKNAYVVILQYQGNPESKDKVALIGKGVTFDSGGYSLKPGSAMITMKTDMSGAAIVCGTIKALALRKAKTNIIGVIGLVENMVNGSALKPGDIINSAKGKTIEVLNTDAEGRLVLADLLYYTQSNFNPIATINLATLTGAIVMSLGEEMAGLFSNNTNLADNLLQVSNASGELLWKMPLHTEYKKYLKSSNADLQNITMAPRSPGAIFAGMFLQEFVNESPWAHLDIAGVSYSSNKSDLHQRGATGFGVRLLNKLIKEYYEH